MEKTVKLIADFSGAVERLREALAEPKTALSRDASIQRFEFSFDLCWKLVKAFLEEQKGLVCRSPKDCFRMAYQAGLIDYDDYWLELVEDRNLTAHTYNERMADRVYATLPRALEHFEALLVKLRE